MEQQGYYRRLLVSYLPILFSVFTILVLLIVIGSTHLSRETVKKESLVMAKFIQSAIDRELKAVEQVMYTELLDKNSFRLLTQLNPTHNSYYTTYELTVMLREITHNHPMIDSIYIYRFSDQSVQSMNVTSTLERFGDRDFIRHAVLPGQIDATDWTGVREYREFDGQSPDQVISVMRPIPILREAGGLLVINVNVRELTQLIHRLSDPDSTYVTVTDGAGGLLLESGPGSVLADAVYTSDYTGYTVRLGYREGMLNGILNTMVLLYIVCGSIVVGFGLIWMIYITRRNYKPVHAIVSKLDHLVADFKLPFEKNKDELGFVGQVIEKMIEQSTEFEQRHKETAAIKRRMLFAELREGGFAGTAEEARQLLSAHYGDQLPEGFMMAVVEMDGYDDFAAQFSDGDQALLKFAMYNALIEMAHDAHGISPWADWVSVNQIAVLYPVGRSGPVTQETLTAILEQGVAWIDGNLKMTVSIGVGSPVWEPKLICESYGEAQHMLKYKFTLGLNRVIGYWEIDRMDRTGHLGMIVSTRDLAGHFRLAVPDWQSRLEAWFDDIRTLLVPKEDIDMLLHCLIYHIRKDIAQLGEEYAEAWNEEFDPAIERCMQQKTLAVELGQALCEILKAAGVRLAAIREMNGRAAVLNEVRGYIDLHYADPNLSLALLSETFDINSKTLSRLFKEQFGENFVDYVMKKRIYQAKLLLLESGASIQHISREVGYVNALSFTRAFKKLEGVTPLELRRA
ncbi:Helix-turn-helix domain-containing protein [Paenibacillus sp. UNCCL117]|uniref:helix-turn-helix domain-containing protein n=1 Tax=unclassified Paenibacillus TaxID=185978 RepID=UPI00088522B7|nr:MULTISPECIES: AraC family transcriptional regulator [unclassified Paenibacillus]SDD57324.1 Helix-turn-helix domain-containing protein [Paenibacillus sp. cl123]SFW51204.1 Helix-turn-helix domain-containing protein [Paenibacillus sp. UNCCL117]